MTARYAVFGNPVAHSRSPAIHQAFAEQHSRILSYEKIEAPVDGFAEAVEEFFRLGGQGANVTVPFKEQAFALSARTSKRAVLARAVNTLWQDQDGGLHGDNTDGVGLVRDLENNLGWQLAGRRILVVGAGGAVRGVLGPLLHEQPEELVICNRTVAKAEALVEQFGHLGIPVYAGGFQDLRGRFDLVINAVSAGLHGDMPPLPDDLFSPRGCAYDMVYGDAPTPFVRWAEGRALQAADGLGMLVEQAAESFFMWHSLRPDTRPVIESIRQAAF
jgi:shikimate dehydrogenase